MSKPVAPSPEPSFQPPSSGAGRGSEGRAAAVEGGADDPRPSAYPEPGAVTLPPEIGGRNGPEPTRFGDWEKAGRCIDF